MLRPHASPKLETKMLALHVNPFIVISSIHMRETNMGCLESVALSIVGILPSDLDIHCDART